MKSKGIETKFQDAKLEDIIRFYVNNYRLGKGKTLLDWEYWLDPLKGKVMFRLTIQRDKL